MDLHPHFSSSFCWGQAAIPKSLSSTSDRSSSCIVEILSWKIAKHPIRAWWKALESGVPAPRYPWGKTFFLKSSFLKPPGGTLPKAIFFFSHPHFFFN